MITDEIRSLKTDFVTPGVSKTYSFTDITSGYAIKLLKAASRLKTNINEILVHVKFGALSTLSELKSLYIL